MCYEPVNEREVTEGKNKKEKQDERKDKCRNQRRYKINQKGRSQKGKEKKKNLKKKNKI